MIVDLEVYAQFLLHEVTELKVNVPCISPFHG